MFKNCLTYTMHTEKMLVIHDSSKLVPYILSISLSTSGGRHANYASLYLSWTFPAWAKHWLTIRYNHLVFGLTLHTAYRHQTNNQLFASLYLKVLYTLWIRSNFTEA
jgi:hypothetical protein